MFIFQYWRYFRYRFNAFSCGSKKQLKTTTKLVVRMELFPVQQTNHEMLDITKFLNIESMHFISCDEKTSALPKEILSKLYRICTMRSE